VTVVAGPFVPEANTLLDIEGILEKEKSADLYSLKHEQWNKKSSE
jgi:hypothetical protein